MFLLNGLANTPAIVPNAIFVNPAPSVQIPGTTTQNPTPGVEVNITPSAPWYKTWWGIGLLGLAGFVAYKRFAK